MRAAIFKEKGQPLVIEDIPEPIPKEGQVLVKIKACGICGSDIHASETDWTPKNIVMGHEFSGIIAGLGAGVKKWEVGQRVAALAQITCGKCTECLNKNFHRCASIEYLAYNRKYNGGYSEYVVVGEQDVIPISNKISFGEAAAIEPLAVGLDAIRKSRLKVGENVLIIGGGPIGLTCATWAKFYGAANVVISELNPERLLLAKAMGATDTINPNKETDVIAAFQEKTNALPDIIVEAVGVKGMIQYCVNLAQKRSRILVVGVCQEPDVFEPLKCILKSLELIFPFGYSVQDYDFIIKMMEQERITAKPLISHQIGLAELPTMFEKMKNPTNQCKVIVVPKNFSSN